jgi:hypothetical protein
VTPQSTFLVMAPVAPGRLGALRTLLAGMNAVPGLADPANPLVPFGRFARLHVARFAILDDRTVGDVAAHGVAVQDVPVYLAFLGDCDGSAEAQLREFAALAGHGLRRIFTHCEGFDERADLAQWLLDNNRAPTAQYVNWVGRTVRQAREEAALHAALRAHLARENAHLAGQSPGVIRERLRALVAQDGPRLTPPAPTPISWRMADIVHLIGGAVLIALATPLLLIAAPILAWVLRRREKADPVIAPRLEPEHVRQLALREDHDFTNAFSAIGSLKPGRFRFWAARAALWLVDYGARHVYTRGRLARVGTIHFARWVLIDDNRRLLFASNYDGSLDSYMDDFINKVAFGLNLVFSNGVGYPRTRFLVLGGAKDEQVFKRFLRRHQVPTDVWYKACPGLAAFDMQVNTRIREGLERETMTEAETRRWLALI